MKTDPDASASETTASQRSSPPAGSAAFADLCDKLIEEDCYHWLHPCVQRFRSTEWIADIRTYPADDQRSVPLAHGEGVSMEDACQNAFDDFHDRKRVEARKAALLKNPDVREALELFKQNAAGLAPMPGRDVENTLTDQTK